MQIVFNLPYVFNPHATRVDNAYALRALLDCMVDLNIGFLRCHSVPALYKSGVVYGRTDEWDPIGALYQRGYGDCKSLATALIAERHMQNLPAVPVFRWVRNKDGSTDFHILVQSEEGFEDPSKVLGMGADEVSKFMGPQT